MRLRFSVIYVIMVFLGFAAIDSAKAESIRKPVVAGMFYPGRRVDLEQMIARYTVRAGSIEVGLPAEANLRALILPHAGYIYSGPSTAYASLVLKPHQFSKVIIMGPDHRIGFEGASISTAGAYQTPLGKISLHRDAANLRSESDLFCFNEASDKSEHCLEVILPFLQVYLKEFSLVPIVMGPGDIERYASSIGHCIDQDTLVIASSDLSHYLPYDKAVERDRQTIEMILNLESEKLAATHNRACGIIPIQVLIKLARKHNWQPIVLHYSNSGDTAGSRDRVVGYAAIAFFGGQHMQKDTFSQQQGQALVELARKTIAENLGIKTHAADKTQQALQDDALQARLGTFVTLTKKGQLRGCIGCLEARESVIEGVEHNAVNAAFHDPRFKPVGKNELDEIEIEVSILSEPALLEYSDSQDLLAKLRPGIDGVVLRKGYHTATFLPQVWEQLPEKEEFLSHLCQKAGLSANAWQTTSLEVLTYQVQYFEEEK